MESDYEGVIVKGFHIEHYSTMLLRLCNQNIDMVLEIDQTNTKEALYLRLRTIVR